MPRSGKRGQESDGQRIFGSMPAGPSLQGPTGMLARRTRPQPAHPVLSPRTQSSPSPHPQDRLALTKAHGPRPWKKEDDPVEELVGTILSQNTNDVNSAAAYEQLTRRFRTWDGLSRRPRRAGGRRHPHWRPGGPEGPHDPASPRPDQAGLRPDHARCPGLLGSAPFDGVPDEHSGHRPQDRRLRADVRLRPTGPAGRHAHPPPGDPPGPGPAEVHGHPDPDRSFRPPARRTWSIPFTSC